MSNIHTYIYAYKLQEKHILTVYYIPLLYPRAENIRISNLNLKYFWCPILSDLFKSPLLPRGSALKFSWIGPAVVSPPERIEGVLSFCSSELQSATMKGNRTYRVCRSFRSKFDNIRNWCVLRAELLKDQWSWSKRSRSLNWSWSFVWSRSL